MQKALQVYEFVHALRAAAPMCRIQDTGLLQALLKYCTASKAVDHAKLRGANGSERLVRVLEALAGLQNFGVVYEHREARQHGKSITVLHVSNELRMRLHHLLNEVYEVALGMPSDKEEYMSPELGVAWSQDAWDRERAMRFHTAAVSIFGHSQASREAEGLLRQSMQPQVRRFGEQVYSGSLTQEERKSKERGTKKQEDKIDRKLGPASTQGSRDSKP
jgi:hypothetical protein